MEHFTFAGYWERGDAISHAIAWLLLAMSLASWFFILSKGVMAWRVRRSAHVVQRFWNAPTLADGVAVVSAGDPEGIYLALAEQGAVPALHGRSEGKAGSLGTSVGRSEQVTRLLRDAIHRSTVRLESGLTLLASIASTAPFVGLLGTVWGIYHALAAVSSSGSVEIDKVAGPVGEALIMTGVGLMVAIPAVLAYNGFNRINRLTLSELDAFAHDLHAYLTRE
ncbi:MotA/TolQ/ExbB proton channel family protein [Pseudoduganella umbonata]|uniref:Biopolymer transport protein ExbB n=1 Tax=Pseudoduganella umbonata TaxID=864828 RepID=A0A4V1EDS6_9BURK|nr:MotA/TolQ/ExbB proton channel family protein [Pseudoduganella umbonata]MBB3220350.1 biopolymer transport protein ExbB [Pseudoduganella umbonata]QCP12111.1 MotA/TolQ/ExbB proton channel family protein [Pseudoduganella umbonata]